MKTPARIARNQCYADLIVAERRDVHLRVFSPMNLHAIGPGLHSKVLSLRVPDLSLSFRIQTDPAPHARVDPIGPDNPLRIYDLAAKNSATSGQADSGCVPQQS